jgi:hypothetical protein
MSSSGGLAVVNGVVGCDLISAKWGRRGRGHLRARVHGTAMLCTLFVLLFVFEKFTKQNPNVCAHLAK